MIKKPRLVNAQVMAEEHPDTFEAPTIAELLTVVVGDFVKVCPDTSPGERFWVQVTEVSDDGKDLVGRIDNALLMTHVHGLSEGEFIALTDRNIYAVDFAKRVKSNKNPMYRGGEI